MFSCKFLKFTGIFKNTFLQNVSGQLLLRIKREYHQSSIYALAWNETQAFTALQLLLFIIWNNKIYKAFLFDKATKHLKIKTASDSSLLTGLVSFKDECIWPFLMYIFEKGKLMKDWLKFLQYPVSKNLVWQLKLTKSFTKDNSHEKRSFPQRFWFRRTWPYPSL